MKPAKGQKQAVKDEVVLKRPAAVKKAAKDEQEPISKSKIIQSMPKGTDDGSNPKPVEYMQGKIYTVQRQHKFRCLKVKGDRYSEKSAVWGKRLNKKQAWKACVTAIEDHAKENTK